jgi:hypothetical protein
MQNFTRHSVTDRDAGRDWHQQELPEYLSKRQQESAEIYELVPRRRHRFLSRLGLAAAAAAIAGIVGFAAFWTMHRNPKAFMQSEQDISPQVTSAVQEDAETPAPVVKPVQRRPPEVGYVGSWGITESGATVSWSTDVPATTMLEYGTTPSLGQSMPEQKKLEASHGVVLSGLTSGTTYYYVAKSADKNGVVGSSAPASFKTRGGAGSPPAISAIVVEPSDKNKVKISWKTSKPTYSYFMVGVTTQYQHWSQKTELTATPECSIAWVPSGTLHYQLVSVDADGNQTVSPDYTFDEP